MRPDPLPFAHEDEPERDEDQLDREDDDGEFCEHTLHSIVDAMSRRGPPAVRAVREFATALNEVADAVMAEDDDQFREAAHHACAAFEAIDGDDEGDHDEGDHDDEGEEE